MWNPLITKPFAIVSAQGTPSGTIIANNGADFGPDTPLGNTGPGLTQTSGIQEAIDYIASIMAGPQGGVVYLLPGLYQVQTTINLAKDVTLEGAIGWTDPETTIPLINPTSGFTGPATGTGNPTVIGTNPTSGANVRGYGLRHISVQGSSSIDAIHITNGYHYMLEDVRALGAAYGIVLDSLGNTTYLPGQGQLYSLKADNCTVIGIDINYQTVVQGVNLQSVGQYTDTLQTGIRIKSSNNVQLTNVRTFNAETAGLQITDDGSIACYNNTIAQVNLSGSGGSYFDIVSNPSLGSTSINNRVLDGQASSISTNNATDVVNLLVSNVSGISNVGWGVATTPAIPGGTGSGNKAYNQNAFRIIVYQSGASGTHVVSQQGVDTGLPSDATPFVLAPGDSVYYATTVPTSAHFKPKTLE